MLSLVVAKCRSGCQLRGGWPGDRHWELNTGASWLEQLGGHQTLPGAFQQVRLRAFLQPPLLALGLRCPPSRSLCLAPRSGVIPLDATSDVAGPLARTVEDTVRVFEVTVGVDPSDNLTTLQTSFKVPSNYTQFLRSDGLKVTTCPSVSRQASAQACESSVIVGR